MHPDEPIPLTSPLETVGEPMHPEAGGEAAPGPGYVAGPAPVPMSAGRRPLGALVMAMAIALVAILGGGSLFLSGYVLGVHQAGTPGTSAADQAAFQPFWDAYANVSQRFALGPVAQPKLVEGAIKGLVAALGDPYSTYLSPEDFQNTLSDISGQFEGIGAEIGTVDSTGKTVDCTTFGPDCRLAIVNPLDGSPAQAANLKPGDVVTSVDGTSLDGLTVTQARDKIRGKAGTTVTLHIVRAGVPAFDVTLTRAKIQTKEVITKDLAGGKVGYIRLAGFSEAGADDFVAAVKADVAKGQKALVVDLRGNPGGFIDAADKVASAFIGSGPVFWQQDVNGVQTATDATPGGPATDPSIRVVVLVDKGSASASEIVTGALKDTQRATIVGETTFGKGTVQTWIPLGQNGDEGGVKLTIAKWLTPNKSWIHGIGITPDVPVTVPANTPVGADPVLDRALELLAAPATSPLPSTGPPPSLVPAPSARSSSPGALPPSTAPVSSWLDSLLLAA
ncbi:MAG TPA: S41 family peptidase [Candidatus Limnocylindrales bacterium]|nr:S41 family peptidase [Candidatus Limnocylindrales bacterium]